MVDNSLDIFITRCKYSKIFQIGSTTITKYVGKVNRSKGRESIAVKLPNYIIRYHKHMGGVDCGE